MDGTGYIIYHKGTRDKEGKHGFTCTEMYTFMKIKIAESGEQGEYGFN